MDLGWGLNGFYMIWDDVSWDGIGMDFVVFVDLGRFCMKFWKVENLGWIRVQIWVDCLADWLVDFPRFGWMFVGIRDGFWLDFKRFPLISRCGMEFVLNSNGIGMDFKDFSRGQDDSFRFGGA